MTIHIDRRTLLRAGLAGAGALILPGCGEITRSPSVRELLRSAESLTMAAQRLALSKGSLAPTYSAKDLSPNFKPNGSTNPSTPEYVALRDNAFETYRLRIGGKVGNPLSLSLSDLKSLPSRTQITKHDCVEGWTAIGGWTGVPLSTLLEEARLDGDVRYIVFHCFDTLGRNSAQYYESIDLIDAFHPQTILAYEMNGQMLPVAHGAPLRLRAERHLGYKQAKYIRAIEAVSSFASLHGGRGGYWEDRGYEWYAGI